MAKPDPADATSATSMGRAILGTQIAFEMVLPGLAGFWLDLQWDSSPWGLIVGLAIGQAVAFWHILRLTRTLGGPDSSKHPGGPSS